MIKLSVVLATYNEENNIGPCLDSVKELADEIIIVDGSSIDKTRDIARQFGARVIKTENHPIFHINKQKAIDEARGEWILQMDADERVTLELSKEISKVIKMNNAEIDRYQRSLKKWKLFLRHQQIIDERDGVIGKNEGDFVAFYLPRLNYFLGKYMRWGGVYPDGVIRLIKKGKAYLPAKSVHEQMIVDGRVGWLQNDLLHIDSPTFKRYLERNSRYINLIKDEMIREKTEKNILQLIIYFVFKPIHWFFLTLIRHKGILDGYQGFIFSLFSSLRFPRAYWRYLKES